MMTHESNPMYIYDRVEDYYRDLELNDETKSYE